MGDEQDSDEYKIYGLVFYYIMQMLVIVLLHALALILFAWGLQQYAYLAFVMCLTSDTVILGISSRSQEAVKNERRLDAAIKEILYMARQLSQMIYSIYEHIVRKPREVR